ncbi:MAG: ATP synthase F1 subunit delta [Coriobacteriales bacterium]|jgi:F-type H+-transporting ATPase subunit delta|nr:ATP synthase F1 subunit delta [Coriobacteriales bacterium]
MPTDRVQARKASVIYAKTLLQAARTSDTVFEVADQLTEVLASFRAAVQLREVLFDASLDAAQRRALAEEAFAGFDVALLGVLGVMIEREDLGLLAKVSELYEREVEDALGIVIIEVTTAVALDEGLREAIRAKYAAQFGAKIALRERLDAALIGGIVLSAHGKRIDASIASQLERTRVTLSNRR